MNEDVLDLYYTTIETIHDHLDLMVQAASFCLLCKGFFKKRSQIFLLAALWMGVMAFQYWIPIYMGGRTASAVGSLVLFIAMLFLTGRGTSRSVSMEQAPVFFYLAVTFFSLQRLTGGIALELFLVISDKTMNSLLLKVDASMPDAWKPFWVSDIFALLFFLMMTCLLMPLFSYLVNRLFYDKEGKYNWKEIGILLVPSIAGGGVLMLRRSYENLILEQTGKNVFTLSYQTGILLSLNYLTLLLLTLIVLYFYQNLRRRQEADKRKSLLQNQMKAMQSHIAEVERIYTGIKGIRHDLNNHIHIIGSLLETKQYREAEQYLETLRDTAAQFDFPVRTGNPITDVILSEKHREAVLKQIAFASDFYFIQDSAVDVFDLSIILHNTLENAFAAALCSEKPFVSIHSERKKNVWLITVVNSYDGTLRFGQDGMPASDKSEQEESGLHGLGLKNIKAVVEKYYGTFAIEQSGSEVTVTVMLMLG